MSTVWTISPHISAVLDFTAPNQDVKISGIAFTEDLIAQYMKALEASKDFMTVELIVSEQVELAGTKLKKFDLSMKLESALPPPPAGPATK